MNHTSENSMTLLARMAAVLRACADDLESEVIHRYGGVNRTYYPSEEKKLNRDLASIADARAVLAEWEALHVSG